MLELWCRNPCTIKKLRGHAVCCPTWDQNTSLAKRADEKPFALMPWSLRKAHEATEQKKTSSCAQNEHMLTGNFNWNGFFKWCSTEWEFTHLDWTWVKKAQKKTAKRMTMASSWTFGLMQDDGEPRMLNRRSLFWADSQVRVSSTQQEIARLGMWNEWRTEELASTFERDRRTRHSTRESLVSSLHTSVVLHPDCQTM